MTVYRYQVGGNLPANHYLVVHSLTQLKATVFISLDSFMARDAQTKIQLGLR